MPAHGFDTVDHNVIWTPSAVILYTEPAATDVVIYS